MADKVSPWQMVLVITRPGWEVQDHRDDSHQAQYHNPPFYARCHAPFVASRTWDFLIMADKLSPWQTVLIITGPGWEVLNHRDDSYEAQHHNPYVYAGCHAPFVVSRTWDFLIMADKVSPWQIVLVITRPGWEVLDRRDDSHQPLTPQSSRLCISVL